MRTNKGRGFLFVFYQFIPEACVAAVSPREDGGNKGRSVLTESERETEIQNSVLDLTAELLREVHGSVVMKPQLSMKLDRDLGLDSLTRVELLNRVERRWHVSIPDESYVRIGTLADLAKIVSLSQPRIGFVPEQRAEPVKSSFKEGQGELAIELPAGAETLLQVLQWHSQRSPNRVHIEMYQDDGKGRKITYADLQREAEVVAANLRNQGLKSEQAVILMLPTSEDYFFVFWGVLCAGGIPVPIYPPARMQQIEEHIRRHIGILQNCEAAMLITISEGLRFSHLLQGHVPSLQLCLTAEELRQPGSVLEPLEVMAEQTAFIQYTSGSTGQPKGVVLSHKNILHSVRTMGAEVRACSADVFLSWLPLYHDMGLIGAWFGCLYFAVPLVVMSPLQFLSRPERWLWAIHRYRATLTAAPNFAFEICVRKISTTDIKGLDLSSLRACFNGAEPVSSKTLQDFSQRFAPYGFQASAMTPVYGLAENTLGLTFTPLGRGPRMDKVDRAAFQSRGEARASSAKDQLQFVSCGFALKGNELRIVDERGHELPSRHEGHLQFRSPASTKGYCRNPEKTEELFHGEWLDSGDLAYVAEGELYVTGRVKDVIIRAGRKIHPFEIEEAVGHQEGVRSGGVVVFGVFDEKSGTERLIVVAETKLTDSQGREDLLGRIHSVVTACTGAPAEDVVLVPPKTVLKTSSGKIRRSACREVYLQNSFTESKPPWMQWVRLGVMSVGSLVSRLSRKLMADIYSLYVWGLFLWSVPFVLLILLLVPSATRSRRILRGLLLLLSRLSGLSPRVSGLENLKRAQEGCVLVANHESYLDGFVLVAALDLDFSFVVKAELKKNPMLALLLRRLQSVYVERFDWEQSLQDAQRLSEIARGSNPPLLIFPEGTFTRQYGLRPFHMGAFVVAAQTGRSLIPIIIKGTRDILRDGSWKIHKGPIEIRITNPITPDPQSNLWQTAQSLKQKTEKALHP